MLSEFKRLFGKNGLTDFQKVLLSDTFNPLLTLSTINLKDKSFHNSTE